MKYFLLEKDPSFDTSPDILDWFKNIDRRLIKKGKSHKIGNRMLLFIRPNPETFFTDVLSFPFFMVTQDLKGVIGMYEPHTLFKEIILLDKEHAKTCIYYIPVLDYVDCLSPESELTLDRSTVIKPVIDIDKIGDRSIFYLGEVGNLHTVARLDIVESFLRRGAKGIGLKEVGLVNGI